MKEHVISGALAVALAGVLIGGAAAAVRARDERHPPVRVERSVPARGIDTVRADVKIGAIRVETGNGDQIEINAVRYFGDLSDEDARRYREGSRVEIDTAGDAVVIKDVIPEGSWKGDRRSVNGNKSSPRLEVAIRMPRRLALDAKTGVGSLELSGGSGPSAEVGDVRVESGVGDVKLRALACTGSLVSAKAGVGDVSVSFAALPRSEVKADVGVGKLRVGLPASARASVHLASGMGNVSSGFALKKSPRGPFSFGGTQTGDLNGGGPAVRLNVGVGDARLDRE